LDDWIDDPSEFVDFLFQGFDRRLDGVKDEALGIVEAFFLGPVVRRVGRDSPEGPPS
jgi:hypothetical protein